MSLKASITNLRRVLTASLFLFALAHTAYGAGASCSVATLKQSYGYRISGFVGPSAPFAPFSTVGVQTFDGAGRFTATNTLATGPEITRDFSFSGTYTVNADCTGVMTAEFGKLYFVIVSNGDELFVISIDAGNNWSGVFKRL